MIQIIPLTGIGEITAGHDVVAELEAALKRLSIVPEADDVIVVTQKVISKAEGRFVDLRDVVPCEQALELAALTRKDARLVELVLRESTDVVRAAPHVLITRHRSGAVMANAGLDRSNLGPADAETVLLLPQDADVSARNLHRGLAERRGTAPGIVISDSFGRPWRVGVVNVAIGAWGLSSLIDRRGQYDRDGRLLEVTQVAFADLLASAAGLAMGEGAEGVPAVLVRGVVGHDAHGPASTLVRPSGEDLFR
jgi:coenzyme F420-0:L-glutamate ligase/coenzyme F420-1:gamma-L-glutamate ligase